MAVRQDERCLAIYMNSGIVKLTTGNAESSLVDNELVILDAEFVPIRIIFDETDSIDLMIKILNHIKGNINNNLSVS